MREGRPEHKSTRSEAWNAFERLAETYDLWYRTPLGALVDALEKEAMFSLAEVRTGEMTLDVGCGTGNYTLELARLGAIAFGVDPSARMLKLAQRKASEQRLPISFTSGFVEELPFPDQTFDLITCVTALEFTSSPKGAVSEMIRALKPGGRLVIGVLNAWSLWALARHFERRETIYSHARFFSLLELVGLLRPYGNVTWRTAVFVPPWYVRPKPTATKAIEFLGRLLLKPFGAFIAARVMKGG